MELKIFGKPTCTVTTSNNVNSYAWDSWGSLLKLITGKVVEYSYVRHWDKVGDFTLKFPMDETILNAVELGGFISVDNADWLMIEDISYDSSSITLKGPDAKGLLNLRVSLYRDPQEPGTQGYDVIAGTTKECIKHYLDANCIDPEDTSRALPIVFSTDSAAGLTDDHYMARLESLADIVNKLCVDAELGYSMTGRIPDVSGNRFSFRLRKGTDRTINQSNNAYVIFGSDREKVVELSFDHSVSTLLNYVYAEDSNKTVDEVSRYGNPAVYIESYIDRRECTVSVGISTSQETGEYFDSYVLNEIADNVETHSCEVATAYSEDFGSRYDLGDKVSILDRFTGNVFDMVITSAEKSYSCGQSSLKLTFGRPKDKPLDRIVNSFVSGTARRQ